MTNKLTTDLEVFQYVTEKLLAQGERSVSIDDGYSCNYRGFSSKVIKELDKEFDENYNHLDDDDELKGEIKTRIMEQIVPDLKCAVGHIIDNSVYDISLEEKQADDSSVLNAIKESNPYWDFLDSSMEMLMVLQAIHDREEVGLWKVYFDKFTFDENESFISTDWQPK